MSISFVVVVGPVVDLAVSCNGEFCCTISDDKIVKVFDVINFGEFYFPQCYCN